MNKYFVTLTSTVIVILTAYFGSGIITSSLSNAISAQQRKADMTAFVDVDTNKLSNQVSTLNTKKSELAVQLEEKTKEVEKLEKDYARKLSNIQRFSRAEVLTTVTNIGLKHNVVIKMFYILKEPNEKDELTTDILGRYSIEAVGTIEDLTAFYEELRLVTDPISTGALSIKQNFNVSADSGSYMSRIYDRPTVYSWFDKTLIFDSGLHTGQGTFSESTKPYGSYTNKVAEVTERTSQNSQTGTQTNTQTGIISSPDSSVDQGNTGVPNIEAVIADYQKQLEEAKQNNGTTETVTATANTGGSDTTGTSNSTTDGVTVVNAAPPVSPKPDDAQTADSALEEAIVSSMIGSLQDPSLIYYVMDIAFEL